MKHHAVGKACRKNGDEIVEFFDVLNVAIARNRDAVLCSFKLGPEDRGSFGWL